MGSWKVEDSWGAGDPRVYLRGGNGKYKRVGSAGDVQDLGLGGVGVEGRG